MVSRAFSLSARISLPAPFRAHLYNAAMSAEIGITREELLALPKAHGYDDFTEHKLVRWRHEGLIQRPEQRSLGRGRGTQTVYPSGAEEQLLALCAIHANERRLDHVAWHLWWADYEVSLEPIRSFMASVVAEWDRHAPDLIDTELGGLSDEGYKLARRVARRRRLDQPLSGMRRRVGKERFGVFLTLMLEALVGDFVAFSDESTKDSEEDKRRVLESDRRIVERGWSLKQEHDRRPENVNHWPRFDIEACLRGIGWLASKGSLQQELNHLTDEQLIEARNETRSWLALLGGYGLMFERWLGRWGPIRFVSAMGRVVSDMGAQEQALFTLVWAIARYRGPKHLREGLAVHGKPTPEMEAGLRDWERLEQMRSQIPALSKVLTPQRIKEGFKAAFRGQRELERFERELEDVSRQIAEAEK
jgi:hypothetical protein